MKHNKQFLKESIQAMIDERNLASQEYKDKQWAAFCKYRDEVLPGRINILLSTTREQFLDRQAGDNWTVGIPIRYEQYADPARGVENLEACLVVIDSFEDKDGIIEIPMTHFLFKALGANAFR